MPANPPVRLRKESGGCTLAGYHWDKDGDIIEVPYDRALELLAIPDGDFSIPDDEDDPRPGRPKERSKGRSKAVTEPAPEPAAKVTEPAPAGDEIAEDGAGPEE